MSIRPVKRIVQAQPTMEGAGVHLHRAFGFGETSETDPFLLFDDFRNDVPRQYQAGFPWHPHRGMDIATYMVQGVAASRPSPTCWPATSSTPTHWVIAACWAPVTCSG